MGKFEKLVVLTVLLVAAIVLAFSFSRGGEGVEAGDPLSGARERLGSEPMTSGPMTPEFGGEGLRAFEETPFEAGEAASEPAPSLLLNAGIEPAPSAGLRSTTPTGGLTLAPTSDSTSRILGDVSGLRPSFLDEYMLYTVAEGDTWSSLAQRFYQDGRYTRNLHLANEDMPELVVGKEILVPVFDFLAVAQAPSEEPSTGLEADTLSMVASPGVKSDLAKPAAKPLPQAPVAGGAPSARLAEYEVRSGDTLSDISLAVFGTATRWQEIMEVNKDRLSKPEALQVGMKLRIPEGGKLPAAAPAKAVQTKTAQSKEKPQEKAASAPAKKKKVL